MKEKTRKILIGLFGIIFVVSTTMTIKTFLEEGEKNIKKWDNPFYSQEENEIIKEAYNKTKIKID